MHAAMEVIEEDCEKRQAESLKILGTVAEALVRVQQESHRCNIRERVYLAIIIALLCFIFYQMR